MQNFDGYFDGLIDGGRTRGAGNADEEAAFAIDNDVAAAARWGALGVPANGTTALRGGAEAQPASAASAIVVAGG